MGIVSIWGCTFFLNLTSFSLIPRPLVSSTRLVSGGGLNRIAETAGLRSPKALPGSSQADARPNFINEKERVEN